MYADGYKSATFSSSGHGSVQILAGPAKAAGVKSAGVVLAECHVPRPSCIQLSCILLLLTGVDCMCAHMDILMPR